MNISFYCYKCGQHIVIDEAGVGISIQCPKCGQNLSVPPENAQQAAMLTSERTLPLGWIIAAASMMVILFLAVATCAVLYKYSSLRTRQDSQSPLTKTGSATGTSLSKPVGQQEGKSMDVLAAPSINTSTAKPARETTNGGEVVVQSGRVMAIHKGEPQTENGLVVVVPVYGYRTIFTPGEAGTGSSYGAFSSPGAMTQRDPIKVRQVQGERLIAVVKHPREDSIAEGDAFCANLRHEGTVEWKDTQGRLRRLPRWVYVSE